MIGSVFLVGLGLLAGGGVLSTWRQAWGVGLSVQAAGASLVALTGFAILAEGGTIGAGFTNAFHLQVGVDPLSGLFLGTLGLIAAPALVYSLRYLRPHCHRRAIAGLMALFLLVLVLVLVARDPVTFLTGWELMTLLPVVVILVARSCDARARRVVFTYLAITHLGGVGTWIAILLLARAGAIGGHAVIGSGSGLQVGIALAALVGMGTKAGVMPLHVWLPRAHPIAPAPVSALMSGIMIKIAVYALVRVLVEWVGVLPIWFGVLVLAVGALSALGGVVYAIFQHELKGLLALHSIENIGIIMLGLGACLVLRSRGAAGPAAFALAAGLLHTVNHAVFKALLFLGAGAFEQAVGSLRLDRLGGLLRRMPWAGAAFLVGAMAIAGLPPLNGFASEWLTMQSLLSLIVHGGVGGGLAGAFALAALAATAALALLCFVKVVGLVLLGPARTEGAVTDAPTPMAAAMAFLALVCAVLGLAPGLLFGPLTGLAPWAEAIPSGAGLSGAGLSGAGAGSLPSVGLALTLVILTGSLLVARGRRSAAAAPTWACGQAIEPALNWTSAGFSKPLRVVLRTVLRPRRTIALSSEGGVLQEVSYRGHVPHLIDERIYRPVAHSALAAAVQARRLQNGSVGVYVAYLIGLVVVLLGAARLGLIA